MYSFSYFSAFLALALSFVLALIFTPLIRRIALRFKILDYPLYRRKIHKSPIPLLGGLAVFLAFAIVVFLFIFFTDSLVVRTIRLKNIIGILIGGGVLMLGGFLDDKYDLKPIQQFIWPLLAGLIIVISGIGIQYIGNPFGGGLFYLNQVKWKIFSFQGLPYYFTLYADSFSLLWILGMIYTTKYLDGLDGLVAGETVIAGVILFFLSLSSIVHQPETGLLSLMVIGAFGGFLVFNFHPAKIFLGEGGSTFAGFILAVLAIIAGAKIATTLLIMGIPVLDAFWVILRRIFYEKRSPFKGDKKHLHFRLLSLGLSQRSAVFCLYFFSFVFGIAALFLQTAEKLIALLTLLLFMVILGLALVKLKLKLK